MAKQKIQFARRGSFLWAQTYTGMSRSQKTAPTLQIEEFCNAINVITIEWLALGSLDHCQCQGNQLGRQDEAHHVLLQLLQ